MKSATNFAFLLCVVVVEKINTLPPVIDSLMGNDLEFCKTNN